MIFPTSGTRVCAVHLRSEPGIGSSSHNFPLDLRMRVIDIFICEWGKVSKVINRMRVWWWFIWQNMIKPLSDFGYFFQKE